MAEYSQKVYANGTFYNEDTSYNLGIRRWKGPCLYLKAQTDYEPDETDCEKEMTYICEWKGIQCPANYVHDSHLLDGRTCLGQTGEPMTHSNTMCDTSTDKQRNYLTELDLNVIYHLRKAWNVPLWLGVHRFEGKN